jgi:hypothetical protein
VTPDNLRALAAAPTPAAMARSVALDLATRASALADTLRKICEDHEAAVHIHIKDGGDPDDIPDVEALQASILHLDAASASAALFAAHCDDLIEAITTTLYGQF